ncbi:tRNA (N(6)-L-threonylcarbamoyladenosine(37)-C(2))-methylthiotransferase MtaB, partial [Desulforudis sp. 1190]
RTQGRARAYIKVQEGCRDFCTYCIVPYARGPLRSRPSAAVIDEAPAFEELPISRTQGRARAYIKVQEGCRDFCTYCIVPYARGPLRSRPSAAVI